MTIDYVTHVIRRSRLIMPANEKRFVEKAFLRNADAVVLDLEDSVPVTEKHATRQLIQESIPIVAKGGSEVFVRVNHTEDLLQGDIVASIWSGVDGIIFPKVESGKQVNEVERMVAELEQERGIPHGKIKIGVIIETVKGVLHAEEIAKASKRVDSITLGAEDFSVDSGIELCEDTYAGMLLPRMQLMFAARAHRKLPMGLLGSIAAFNDQDGLEKNARLAYQHGFLGASCIHPNNVEVLNRAFSPTEQDLQYSDKVIAVFENSLARGRASTTLEGKMIDTPHYEKAKQIRERASRIEEFERKKQKAREAAMGGEVI